MKQIAFLILFTLLTTNLYAIDLEKALTMMEVAQDYETAEPIAFSLA